MTQRRSEHWDFIRGLSMFTMLTLNASHITGWKPFNLSLGFFGVVLVEPIIFLSGFLICLRTVPLVTESRLPTGENMKRFALRRIIRTWPLYFLVVGLCFLFPFLADGPIEKSFFRFATFTMNYGLSTDEGFRHMWTLCIEEWCYFIFLLLIPLLRPNGNIPMFGALALLSFSLRTWAVLHEGGFMTMDSYITEVKYPTLVHSDSFWLGCVLAEVFRGRTPPSLKTSRFCLAGAAGLLALYFAVYDIWNPFVQIMIPVWGAAVAALIIWGIQSVDVKILRKTGLVQFGFVSYTFYLFHKILITHFMNLFRGFGLVERGSGLEILLIYFAVLPVGWIFFQAFEWPILYVLKNHRSFASEKIPAAA